MGFIKLDRKILNWEWYKNKNTRLVFLHLLLTANYEPGEWRGIKYGVGECLTSLPKLATDCSLTIQQVRTSLSNMKLTGEITERIVGKCRIITINNWSLYQSDNRKNNRKTTDNQQENQQESNRETNTSLRNKEDKKEEKHIYGEYKHVRLTDKQYDKLIADYGDQEMKDAIRFLDEYIQMKGYKSVDHNLAIRKWVFDAVQRERQKKTPDKPKKNSFSLGENQRDYGSDFWEAANKGDV